MSQLSDDPRDYCETVFGSHATGRPGQIKLISLLLIEHWRHNSDLNFSEIWQQVMPTQAHILDGRVFTDDELLATLLALPELADFVARRERHSLHDQARDLIVQLQNPSVSLLQRYFKLEYASALRLMKGLEGDIVTTPNDEGWRQMLPVGIRVYLDDERPTPDGWVRVYWPEQAIALLKTGGVEELSLDHDLGDDQRGTGYDVVLWIEEAVAVRCFKPPKMFVHSANAPAREKMLAGIRSIENLSTK
jgi:hypothetical protein